MKIFLDTSDIEQIKKWVPTGLINGITTNPTSLSTVSDPKKTIREICKLLPEGDISVEVTQSEPVQVYDQAKTIAKLSDNIWVKIPCHVRYYEVIHKLVQEKVKLNITLVFTLLQSLMMAKLGVYYISPFIGRWDNVDVNGVEIVPQIREMIDYYGFQTQILAASIHTVQQFHEVINAGTDAVTLSPSIFEKAVTNTLTDQGIEKFARDWAKLGISQFP